MPDALTANLDVWSKTVLFINCAQAQGAGPSRALPYELHVTASVAPLSQQVTL